MALCTALTEQYGCEFPLVQAGLAFVGATPALAIAVCRGGGIGGLGVGIMPADAVRGLIRAVRKATAAPFHVNFITFLARREQIDVCVEERVPIVSFHWGTRQPSSSKPCTGRAVGSGSRSGASTLPGAPSMAGST